VHPKTVYDDATHSVAKDMSMISASEALERLKRGNRRFLAGEVAGVPRCEDVRRAELLAGQDPFAIILGCSDSRVPSEIIFNQGLGDLFVIRVAGNIVGISQMGSVEFAAQHFGTRLVVVLGHSGCGAVRATLESIEQPLEGCSPDLLSIVDRIRPAVEGCYTPDFREDSEVSMCDAVRANIRASVEQLRHRSRVLERFIAEEGLVVVGAEYSLATGEVEFFDGVPKGA
jgi:carbonic anhydrase